MVLGLAAVGFDIFHLQVAVFVFQKYYLSPCLKVALSVILVKQVISIFIVNFDKGHIEFIVIVGRPGLKLLENVG